MHGAAHGGEAMTLVYALIWGAALLFGASAVAGLVWAVNHGQVRNFAAAARSIFDEDEPVGMMTDAFPGASADAEDGGRS